MSNEAQRDSFHRDSYGSARDLPSYRQLAELTQALKLIAPFVDGEKYQELKQARRKLERKADVVDAFYACLGERNWIFHDRLDPDDIGKLLTETSDAASAEERLISMYLDKETLNRFIVALRHHEYLQPRFAQIELAQTHYDDGQFSSCVMQLIAVMDGFVSDLEPAHRQGLHARDPEEMIAWDSVVNHHMGLAHSMKTFRTSIRKRRDDEVYEVLRNGIMHGLVVNFNNVVVATKAWNMLFAVGDWADAVHSPAQPVDPPLTRDDMSKTMSELGRYKKYESSFASHSVETGDPAFESDDVIARASELLKRWEGRQWGRIVDFAAPMARKSLLPVGVKESFGKYRLQSWSIQSVTYDVPSGATVKGRATVDGVEKILEFRMAYWANTGEMGIPQHDQGAWTLAIWKPGTYFH